MKKFCVKVLFTSLCLVTMSAQAVMISYDSWVYNSSNEVDWLVTIDDTSNAGQFTFNVGIGDTSLLGDIIGFGFDTGVDYGVSVLDNITNYSAYAFNDCSSSCNWNGTGASDLDYSFSVGSNGAGSDFVTSFSFGLDDFGVALSEDTFSLVAIRAQSVGGGRSVKDYSSSGNVSSVPELSASAAPISLALLSAIFLLGIERRRRPA